MDDEFNEKFGDSAKTRFPKTFKIENVPFYPQMG